LTQLFNTTAVPSEVPALVPEVRKKRSWLPLLTVLFLISYGLMTMLIIEQGYTIESQRALIRELFRDSSELTATKMKAQRDRTVASGQRAQSPKAQAQSPSTQVPLTQAPSAQIPSTQVPMSQVPMTQIPADQSPSSQAAPQTGVKKPAQKQFRMPSKPASELIDDRRALITI
jgi:hypothetical protein